MPRKRTVIKRKPTTELLTLKKTPIF